MGLQGKGEIWNISDKRQGISPFPCTSNVEALQARDWVSGLALGKSARDVARNVEMVADEVFCRLLNNGDRQGCPAATGTTDKHFDVFRQSLEQRDALCSTTNTQMRPGLIKARYK